MKLSTLKMFLNKPSTLIISLNCKGWFKWIPDRILLKIVYRCVTGKSLDLDNPQTFNEKLQWAKLYDRKPLYTQMVDKFGVKQYIAEKIGDEYVIPTLGVWKCFSDINFDKLPNQFVLKCTHDSGGLIICKDKSLLDVEKARQKIEKSMKNNYFSMWREWPYKNVQPQIIAEQYIEDTCYSVLPVYKIFCFNGNPTIIQTIQNDKQPNESIDYFDTQWNRLDMRQNFPNSDAPYKRPKTLELMLELARELSAEKWGFLRVDFYSVDDEHIYFSEFTFFSDAGLASFEPEEWNKKLGELIKIPAKRK